MCSENLTCPGDLKGALIEAGALRLADVRARDIGSQAQCVANACLMAAAPDLLLALEALTDPEGHIRHGYSDKCTGECQDVRAAIAKAKGRAS
jgi:hypothetical protein